MVGQVFGFGQRVVGTVALLFLLAVSGPFARAQNADPSNVVNLLTTEVTKLGILNCAARVNQIANFVGFGPNSGGLIMIHPNGRDQRLFSIEMEIPSSQGQAYINSVFAPNQANGCGASYQAIVYWAEACDVVAQRSFPTFKKSNPLRKDIGVLDGGTTTKVFLMSAGSGCVSIKNEVVF